MKNFIAEGERLPWTNGTGSDVASGAPVTINGRTFVACVDIANGASGAVATCGVFEFAKETGKTFAQFADVYWDAAASKVTSDKDAATAAAVAGGGNAGNGTVGSLTAGANAITETVTLTCIAAGAPTAGTATGAAVAGNTGGSGAITASPAVGAGAKVGVYRAVCIEPDTNAGKFLVSDPDGIEVGVATVAVEFVGGGLTFTIADATDFVAGDSFTITVAAVAANTGTFSVVGSKTGRLADATVAVAYTNGYVAFTIADGTTDFAVGDSFTIAVTAGNTCIGYAASAAGSSATTAEVCVCTEIKF